MTESGADTGERPEAAVHALGRHLTDLLDGVRDAVIVADARDRIVLWNPAATAIFGYTQEEARGLSVSILVPDRLKSQHRAGMANYRHTGHGTYVDSRMVLELPAVHRDGTELDVELTLSPLDTSAGRFVLAIVRDMTEAKERRRNLEMANRALRETNEALEAFAYMVSHDLKEPVRAIEAYLRAVNEDYENALPPDALDLVRRARGSADRLNRLLHGLLALSRLERTDLDLAPVHVQSVLGSDACRGVFEPLLLERGARLDVDEEIPPVRASPMIACQVFGNLVANAVKHNPSPNPRVHVRAEPPEAEGEVHVVVEDNGPGFPEPVLRRFGSSDGRPSSLHSGFGLLIVRRTVERLGGRIRLGGGPEGGRVHVHLPQGS